MAFWRRKKKEPLITIPIGLAEFLKARLAWQEEETRVKGLRPPPLPECTLRVAEGGRYGAGESWVEFDECGGKLRLGIHKGSYCGSRDVTLSIGEAKLLRDYLNKMLEEDK